MKILLVTHGCMASGMKSSLDILIGNTENLYVFDAYIDNQKVDDIVEKFYMNCEKDELKLLISDIYGGSVCQCLTKYINRKHTIAITGINLALLLQLVLINKDDLKIEEIQKLINDSKELTKIIDISELYRFSINEDIF